MTAREYSDRVPSSVIHQGLSRLVALGVITSFAERHPEGIRRFVIEMDGRTVKWTAGTAYAFIMGAERMEGRTA